MHATMKYWQRSVLSFHFFTGAWKFIALLSCLFLCVVALIFSSSATKSFTNVTSLNLITKKNKLTNINSFNVQSYNLRRLDGSFHVGTPVILTYASRTFYSRLENLVGSLNQWAPNFPIMVVDMGLSAEQKKKLLQVKRLHFYNFDFGTYPDHVSDLHTFAWKPIIIAELLLEYKTVIVQDAGQELRSTPSVLLSLLRRDGYFFVKQKSHAACSIYRSDVMLNHMDIFAGKQHFFYRTRRKQLHDTAGGVSGWVLGSPAYHQVLLPALQCALKEECGSKISDQSYLTALVHYAGLNFQEAGKFWADWRLPWYLTSNPLKQNDMLLYSRKFGCPKPYARGVKNVLINEEAQVPLVPQHLMLPVPHHTSIKERALRPGEGCNFQYPKERWNRYSMSEMKNYYKGERVFLIGNAPSINKLPMHLLENEFTLSFNRFYMFHDRIRWRPTMYMCIDSIVCPDIADDINDHLDTYRHAFIPWTYRDTKTSVDYTDYIHDNRRIQWLEFEGKQGEPTYAHRQDAFKIHTRGTVASVGLEVLAHLGFSEIIVIGVDMDYDTHKNVTQISDLSADVEGTEDNDGNHFDPRYFGVGQKFHRPRANQFMMPSFLHGLEIVEELSMQTSNCDYYTEEHSCKNHDNCQWSKDITLGHAVCQQHQPEIEVINAGVGGSLPEDRIPRRAFRSFFPGVSLMDEYNIFAEALQHDFRLNIVKGKVSLAKLFVDEQKIVHIARVASFNINNEILIAPASLATSLIAVSIETHILRGPINGEIVLIQRKFYIL